MSLQDSGDAEELLAPANVDSEALNRYAHDAAHFSTGGQLPDLQFAKSPNGEPDVAVFDFTCMHRAEHASLVRERRGRKLLIGLVGDCLVEVGEHALLLVLCSLVHCLCAGCFVHVFIPPGLSAMES